MWSSIFAEVEIIKKDNVFMHDEIVAKNIWSGAERAIQERNPPIDYYPSTQTHTSEAQATNKHGQWFLTDWGTSFVQLLNSKLDKIIDASTNIEKSRKNECLQFSFQRNKCKVRLLFPQDFPKSGLKAICEVSRVKLPQEIELNMILSATKDQVELVDHIVGPLKEHIDNVASLL